MKFVGNLFPKQRQLFGISTENVVQNLAALERPIVPGICKFIGKVHKTGLIADGPKHESARSVRTFKNIGAVADNMRDNPSTSTHHLSKNSTFHASVEVVFYEDLTLRAPYKVLLVHSVSF